MVDIFVSYASADRDRVEPLAHALEERGWTVWWDRQIPPGKTFDEVIEEALDESSAVIAVWSENGIASRWVRTEAAEGAARNILVPVLLENVRIPLAFRRIQAANLVDWEPGVEHAGFTELVEALGHLIAAAAAGASPTEPEDPVEQALAGARAKAAAGDWQGVISLLEALDTDAASVSDFGADADELLGLARRKQEALELYEEAEVLYADGRWQDVVGRVDQVLQLDPDSPYGADLRDRAERHIDQERSQRLTHLYERAERALAAREWAVAIAHLEELQSIEPAYENAPGLLERAQAGEAADRRYRELREAFRQERWEATVAGVTELTAEHPDYGDPDRLLERARSRLAEAERQAHEQVGTGTGEFERSPPDRHETAPPTGDETAPATGDETAPATGDETGPATGDEAGPATGDGAGETSTSSATPAHHPAPPDPVRSAAADALQYRPDEQVIHGSGRPSQAADDGMWRSEGGTLPPVERRAIAFAGGAVALAILFGVCMAGGGDGGGDDTADFAAETTAAHDPATSTVAPESAAGDDGGATTTPDLSGTSVSVLTLGSETDAASFELALSQLVDDTNVDIVVSSSLDLATLNAAVEGGAAPDIAVIPRPDDVVGFAAAGQAVALPEDVVATLEATLDPSFIDAVTHEGLVYGVAIQAGLQSLVWYSPARFEENGYDVPQSWSELTALQQTMKADGKVPWGFGIESVGATGWPFAHAMDDLLLLFYGPEVYDPLLRHDIPFTDPRVAEAATAAADVWLADGNVLGGRGAVATTSWQDAGLCVADGSCMMHRQGAFYASFLGDAGFPPDDAGISAFRLPSALPSQRNAGVGYGMFATAFADRPEVIEVMRFLSSAGYADERVRAATGGFFSPNRAHDPSLHGAAIDRLLAEMLIDTEPFRFRLSDSVPFSVLEVWWRGATNLATGEGDVDTMLADLEAAWP